MLAKPIFIHAITPLHAGSGQGVDVIDQPIARERATQLPLLPGSSIKGVLRDRYQDDNHPEWKTLFGLQTPEESYAGALQFSDARLLLLPVRSLAATFSWIACPFVLKRLARDLKSIYGAVPNGLPSIPTVTENLWLASESACTLSIAGKTQMALEDICAPVMPGEAQAKAWANWIGDRLFPNGDAVWKRELASRFAILDDANFTHLAEYATEVAAHIEIDDEKGTADSGKLWYQESLPAETVLVGIVRADKPRKPNSALEGEQAVLNKLKSFDGLQFGGKSTTGHGVARFILFS